MTRALVSAETNMSVAKRFWEGIFKKGATEIGFGEGSISIDRNVQFHYDLGEYDLTARRSTARVIECTIDHGFISSAMFMASAIRGSGQYPGSGGDSTFEIYASLTGGGNMHLSGCMVTTYDWELPSDGWITESVNVRVKTIG